MRVWMRDDIAMPDRLLKQVTFMKTHSDIGVLGTECDIIDENGKIVDKLTPDIIVIHRSKQN